MWNALRNFILGKTGVGEVGKVTTVTEGEMVRISFSIEAETPEDGAAAYNGITKRDYRLQQEIHEISHKVDDLIAEVAGLVDADLVAAAREAQPVIDDVAASLNFYTPETLSSN